MQGADVNARDAEGRTPLHHAVMRGHLQIVDILLEKGGPGLLLSKDILGCTPVHLAAVQNQVTLIRKLVTALLKDEGGTTPLHEMARRQCMQASHTSVCHSHTCYKRHCTHDSGFACQRVIAVARYHTLGVGGLQAVYKAMCSSFVHACCVRFAFAVHHITWLQQLTCHPFSVSTVSAVCKAMYSSSIQALCAPSF